MVNKGMIQSVTGIVEKSKLGYCQCHEHLFISKGESFRLNPALWMDDSEKTVEELKSYRMAGGRSLVDAQPAGCGRMADRLKKASEKSGVKIIASTGFHKLCFYPEKHHIRHSGSNALADMFISEIMEGMFISDSGKEASRMESKAGIIKAALDTEGWDGCYGNLFEAVFRASRETGASIMCHVEKGADFPGAVNFFMKNAASPASVIFCHLDRATYDIGLHKEAVKEGFYLEYDTIARPKYHSDEKEIKLISEMAAAGFEKSILLGLDTNRDRLKSYGGKTGLDYIITEFIPGMKSAGIPLKTIENFTVNNPADALSFK